MPLLNVAKPKKEEEWKFNYTEQNALLSLPAEQVKAAEHDVALINQMVGCEAEEPEVELVRKEVMLALDIANINPIKALAATAHMTVQERNKVIRRIAEDFMRTPISSLDSRNKTQSLVIKTLYSEDLRYIDLFDFMIKLEAQVKRNS